MFKIYLTNFEKQSAILIYNDDIFYRLNLDFKFENSNYEFVFCNIKIKIINLKRFFINVLLTCYEFVKFYLITAMLCAIISRFISLIT